MGQPPSIQYKTKNIQGRADQARELWKFVVEWTGHPDLVHYIAKLIDIHNIDARDELKLARAVQLLAQKIKYFREYPERWQSPCRTIAWNIGDCDDKSILIATALRSFRIPVRLVFLRFVRDVYDGSRMVKVPIAHVYPEAWLDNKWTALEAVRPLKLGENPTEIMKRKGYHVQLAYYGDTPAKMKND